MLQNSMGTQPQPHSSAALPQMSPPLRLGHPCGTLEQATLLGLPASSEQLLRATLVAPPSLGRCYPITESRRRALAFPNGAPGWTQTLNSPQIIILDKMLRREFSQVSALRDPESLWATHTHGFPTGFSLLNSHPPPLQGSSPLGSLFPAPRLLPAWKQLFQPLPACLTFHSLLCCFVFIFGGHQGQKARLLTPRPPSIQGIFQSLQGVFLLFYFLIAFYSLAHSPLTSGNHVIVLMCSLFVCLLCMLFLKLIFIGVQLLYNVVLISTVQQSESVIRIHISPLFGISFPFRSPQSTEQSSLSYTVGSHQLSILYIVSVVYMSIPISQLIPPLHLSPLGICLFSTCVSLFLFCK